MSESIRSFASPSVQSERVVGGVTPSEMAPSAAERAASAPGIVPSDCGCGCGGGGDKGECTCGQKQGKTQIVYALGTAIPSLVIALWLAMAFAHSTRVNAVFRALVFMPVLIPLVAAASLFMFIFMPGVGLLDFYISRYLATAPNWLGDPDIALWSITALTVWKNAGYYMLFFLAGLQAIPPDAYEAARLDGANAWQRLTLVTLPYLKPTIGFVAVIALLNIVTQVDHVFILTKGGPSDSTNLLLFYIYQQAAENYDIGRASAATLVTLALLLVITIGSLRTLERSFGGPEA